MKSLRSAKTFDELCALHRDNYSTKHFWISADGHTVSLYEQTSGEAPKAEINIPRRQFNALIDFYQRDQPRR